METTSQPIDRSGFDEAIANLFSNPKYAPNYLFYGHMVGQCRVVFDTTMQAPAGVNFMHDHFNLYINPNDQWVEIDPAKLTGKHKPKTRTTADGKTEALIPGFNSSIPLEQRLGILKHEMLHILYNHMRRKGDRDHQGFNIASDCAINQMIERGTPTTITESLKTKIKELLADKSKQNAVLSMQFKDLQELYDYLRKI